jgi:8-oxo-dGTP pyrophosphatase MutT (NUDIX family)
MKSIARMFSSNANNDLRIEYLKQSLAKYHRPNEYELLLAKNRKIETLKRSSILIPISVRQERNEKGMYVQKSFYTFTKRSKKMNVHPGEVCFVGGNRDKLDKNEIDTVVREAREEIGLDSSRLTILAQLFPMFVISKAAKYLVTPVIAFLDDENFSPKCNKDEVDFVFEMETINFLNKQNHTYKSVKSANKEFFVHYFEDSVNERKVSIWGMTSILSVALSSMLHSRPPDFSVDPDFQLNGLNLNHFLEFYLDKCSHLF